MPTASIPNAEMVRAIGDVRRQCGQDDIAEHLECAADLIDELYEALEYWMGRSDMLPDFTVDDVVYRTKSRDILAKARGDA
jgi:hypothetical protein